MKTRVISGIVLLAVMFVLLYLGGYVLLLALLAVSLMGGYEYNKALSSQHHPYYILSAVMTVAYYAMIFIKPEAVLEGPYGMVFLLVFFLCVMAASVIYYPKRGFEGGFLTYTGVIYVSVLFSLLYFVREHENGIFLIWFIIWASWGCDTCAYFAGKFLGKHKMAPFLSPKKTIEGAVGGVVGSVILCVVYGLIIRPFLTGGTGYLMPFSICVGVFGSILSQVGDLFASSIKRRMNIKDFGHLIPGHGGILDRFDSMLLSGSVVALFLLFVFG